MKYIIIALLLLSCTKQPQERTLEIWGYDFDYSIEEKRCGNGKDENYKCYGSALNRKANTAYKTIVESGYSHEIKIFSRTFVNHSQGYKDNHEFTIKVLVNGKNVYHKKGAFHEVKI